jgi:hypothetical protein
MNDDEEERALQAAYDAQQEALAAATGAAQNAVGHDDLTIFDQRFGVFIAKQERTGLLDFGVIERLAMRLVASAPPPVGDHVQGCREGRRQMSMSYVPRF